MENSIALRKAISLRASGSCTARSSSGTSRSTLSSSSTSCREIRAFSAFSIRASRRFGCLISPARNSNCSRSPYSTINCAAVLTPMPGTPGTLSVESPASACTSTTFSGGTPNFSITSGMPMRRSFMVSYIVTLSVTSCIRSLSEETMVVVAPRSPAEPRIGRDQIVGLEADLFQAGQVERAHRLADQRKLRDQIVRRRRPVRLVIGIELVAERDLGFVEDDRQMRRPVILGHVAQQLPQHVAEAEHGIDLQPVGLAVQGRQRVIGAENVGGTVDQEHMVALADAWLAPWRGLWRQQVSRRLWGLISAWPKFRDFCAD